MGDPGDSKGGACARFRSNGERALGVVAYGKKSDLRIGEEGGGEGEGEGMRKGNRRREKRGDENGREKERR